MPERGKNKCHEVGCLPNPSCCHGDSENPLILDIQRRNLKHFSDALPFARMDEVLAQNPQGPHIFVEELPSILDWSDHLRLYIVGNCTHEDEDGNCDIHKDPFRPAVCGLKEIGGDFCNGCRLLDGRPPVSKEVVISISDVK